MTTELQWNRCAPTVTLGYTETILNCWYSTTDGPRNVCYITEVVGPDGHTTYSVQQYSKDGVPEESASYTMETAVKVHAVQSARRRRVGEVRHLQHEAGLCKKWLNPKEVSNGE